MKLHVYNTCFNNCLHVFQNLMPLQHNTKHLCINNPFKTPNRGRQPYTIPLRQGLQQYLCPAAFTTFSNT